jgi:hypothetical protein
MLSISACDFYTISGGQSKHCLCLFCAEAVKNGIRRTIRGFKGVLVLQQNSPGGCEPGVQDRFLRTPSSAA